MVGDNFSAIAIVIFYTCKVILSLQVTGVR